ncbi:hypothetical protein AVL63_12760 [Nesterenkonia jeotgali]|uniref:Uncharacterized protein n=1 Tax=Nesterenkonia jeotgali TaxID=317018 RepID=A0A0W8IC41_9MICC|nr:hypothetical protein AVL63_12760 [Nesterenkonia jeotgali]
MDRLSIVIDLLPALITTIGTLVGSFGGFTLAARAQRKQADRDDVRAVRDAERSRSTALEDERHEFQLETLLALQELTRLKSRNTILLIMQDRSTIKIGESYRLLPGDDREDFENSIKFSHNVARVTDTTLRKRLESFSSLSGQYSLPPRGSKDMEQDDALAIQDERLSVFMDEAEETSVLLGEYLRKEIDRHSSIDRR